MTAQVDIAIIGGGVIGLTLARRLSRDAPSLAVIDAGSEIPPATLAAAGMLAPSFEVGDGAEALYELGASSLRAWPGFAKAVEAQSGTDIDYRDDGMFGVALDDAGARALARQGADLAARGAAVAMIDGAEARRREPALSPDVVAALDAPNDAQVDAAKLAAALRICVADQGGALIAGRVAHCRRDGRRWQVRLGDGAALCADTVVMATGAGAGWPVDGAPRPPIFPVKGEALAVDADAAPFTRVIRGPGAYLCPKAGGRLVIGATEHAGVDSAAPDAHAVAALRERAVAVAPGAAAARELGRWAGLRPATPDGAPILGQLANGVWAALGHHRNGVLLAPASAEALASAILGDGGDSGGGDARDVLAAFSPARFG